MNERIWDKFTKCPIDVDHEECRPLAKPSMGAVPACRKDRLVALGKKLVPDPLVH